MLAQIFECSINDILSSAYLKDDKSKKDTKCIILLILVTFVLPLIFLIITTITGEKFIENKNEITFARMGITDISNGIYVCKSLQAKDLNDKQSLEKAIDIVSSIKLEKIDREKVDNKASKAYSIYFGENNAQAYMIALEDGTFIFEDLKVYEKMNDLTACYPVPENLYISTKKEINNLEKLKNLFKIDF